MQGLRSILLTALSVFAVQASAQHHPHDSPKSEPSPVASKTIWVYPGDITVSALVATYTQEDGQTTVFRWFEPPETLFSKYAPTYTPKPTPAALVARQSEEDPEDDGELVVVYSHAPEWTSTLVRPPQPGATSTESETVVVIYDEAESTTTFYTKPPKPTPTALVARQSEEDPKDDGELVVVYSHAAEWTSTLVRPPQPGATSTESETVVVIYDEAESTTTFYTKPPKPTKTATADDDDDLVVIKHEPVWTSTLVRPAPTATPQESETVVVEYDPPEWTSTFVQPPPPGATPTEPETVVVIYDEAEWTSTFVRPAPSATAEESETVVVVYNPPKWTSTFHDWKPTPTAINKRQHLDVHGPVMVDGKPVSTTTSITTSTTNTSTTTTSTTTSSTTTTTIASFQKAKTTSVSNGHLTFPSGASLHSHRVPKSFESRTITGESKWTSIPSQDQKAYKVAVNPLVIPTKNLKAIPTAPEPPRIMTKVVRHHPVNKDDKHTDDIDTSEDYWAAHTFPPLECHEIAMGYLDCDLPTDYRFEEAFNLPAPKDLPTFRAVGQKGEYVCQPPHNAHDDFDGETKGVVRCPTAGAHYDKSDGEGEKKPVFVFGGVSPLDASAALLCPAGMVLENELCFRADIDEHQHLACCLGLDCPFTCG